MLRIVFTKKPTKYDVAFLQQLQGATFQKRFSSKPSENSGYGQQLGGFEYREEFEPLRSKWRKPLSEQGYWKSKLEVFSNKQFAADLTRYNPDNFKYLSIKRWWHDKKMEKIVYDQLYNEDRMEILGCELAAAHFVVFRKGAVKFYNHANWIRDKKDNREYDEELPNTFDSNYIVEALDLSNTIIVYDGLQNIERLRKLKWLSFSKCTFFDDWCLDKISGEYGPTLEYLDISYTNCTYDGLNALYRFKNLKTLVLDDRSEDPELYLICLAFMKCLPGLKIEGINFDKITEEDVNKQI